MSRSAWPTARRIGERLKAAGWRIAIAELATGGAVADRLTDVAGSSAYVVGAIVPGANGPAGLRPAGAPADQARQAAAWIRTEFETELGLATVPTDSSSPSGLLVCLIGPDFQVAGAERRSADPANPDALTKWTIRWLDRSLAARQTAPLPA